MKESANILIVDDNSLNRKIASMVLGAGGYSNIMEMSNPSDAFGWIENNQPDLILIDVSIQSTDGLKLLEGLCKRYDKDNIAIIVLTSVGDIEIRRKAFELGARDFVIRPFDTYELTARVDTVLRLKMDHDKIRHENRILTDKVAQRNEQLKLSNLGLIKGLGRAAELKDNDTGQHVMRVGLYSSILADGVGLSQEQVNYILQAAPMHDIGKIGVPDGILLKPAKLTDEEFKIVQKHCQIGAEIFLVNDISYIANSHPLKTLEHIYRQDSDLLRTAGIIALTHHEKWDGTGYPIGLRGEEIPIEGRITALADVYDALNTKRPYKDKYPLERCFEIIKELSGTHFDPQIVDEFCNFIEILFQIQKIYSDSPSLHSVF
ncbi:MAG: response regulator [Candidatus Auribacterota bacterium]|jgi:putative two-component system response regulator|nr:response regulator [Candidatus Auribacterota bacterium]